MFPSTFPVRCQACGNYQTRSVQISVLRWPRVLVLHQKRWEIVRVQPYQEIKNNARVSFETLLPLHTEEGNAPYHLRGVVVHSGEAGGGHYIAYVRASNNLWYCCDCGSPQPPHVVSTAEVLEAQAYLLMYEQ